MAFLCAAYGPLAPSDWAGQVSDLGDWSGGVRLRDWQDQEGIVRLAALDPSRAAIGVGPARAAAMVGLVEAGAGGAAAVLEAYDRAGVSGLASLRGEFAYVLWDGRDRSLFVGCDAVGLRALAYNWNGRTFLASTRALSLLGQADRPPAFDPVYLAHALGGIWSRSASATAFAGVRRMLGGELLRVSSRGLERLEGARLTFRAPRRQGRDGAVRELAEVLDEAVAGDAGRGASCVSISGGLDSCVVATALARKQTELAALSLVAPEGCPGDAASLSALVAAFPGLRHHPIPLTGDTDSLNTGPLSDDPICAGPILQSGRAALLRAARNLGFQRVFNGDGADEIFEMAWRPGDLIRQGALGRVFSALGSRTSASRLVRGFIIGGRGPLSDLALERARARVRARRPWLRSAFWESPSFASAWTEVVTFARRRGVRDRLPEILGAHGRHWRAQELERLSAGVEGSSPFLRRSVVELVGSLSADVAVDLTHGKVLMRHLAAQRVAPGLAWRPKNEPLSEWLIARWITSDAHSGRVLSQIKDSPVLAPLIDVGAVIAAIDAARRLRGQHSLASPLVELAAVTEWVSAVEARWRV